MSANRANAPYYFVPGPSRHPISASVGLLIVLLSSAAWVNAQPWAPWTFLIGLLWFLFVLRAWFADAISESEGGRYGDRVDASFRWSMSWFIFSEVMFFAAFFGALFYARTISMPWLGDLNNKLLWPDFNAIWPNAGPAGTVAPFTTMGPWPIPTINTALLLTSGVTLTWAHHALREGKRAQVIQGLLLTIILGFTFMGFQAYEYIHAYHELNLEADLGDLWLDVLPAYRLPRFPRDDGRDHAGGGAGPRDQGPFHAGAPLRVRGRRVVLALCGRGVAWPVRGRVLAINRA